MRDSIRKYLEKRVKAAQIKAANEAITFMNEKRTREEELKNQSINMQANVSKAVEAKRKRARIDAAEAGLKHQTTRHNNRMRDAIKKYLDKRVKEA